MTSRSVTTGLVLFSSLLAVGSSLAQESTPAGRRERERGANPANLERRLAEMEKQLQSLSREVEAIRKEIKPRAASDEKIEVKIFSVLDADAAAVVKTLQQLLQAEEMKTLRIVPHGKSILVRGNRGDITLIEAIIVRLDQEAASAKEAKR